MVFAVDELDQVSDACAVAVLIVIPVDGPHTHTHRDTRALAVPASSN